MGYKVRPAFLSAPLSFFFRKYGVNDEREIYAESRVLGIRLPFTQASHARLSDVVSRHAQGAVFGSVTFSLKGGGKPIVWEDIYRPAMKADHVKKLQDNPGLKVFLKVGQAEKIAREIYNKAIAANGKEKLDFAERYIYLLRNAHPNDEREIVNRGRDLFQLKWSVDHLDKETKKNLFLFAQKFHREALKRGWDYLDMDHIKEELLDQQSDEPTPPGQG